MEGVYDDKEKAEPKPKVKAKGPNGEEERELTEAQSRTLAKLARRARKRAATAASEAREQAEALVAEVAVPTSDELAEAGAALRKLAAAATATETGAKQDGLRMSKPKAEGGESRNMWIAKPGSLSRGRAIRVFNDEAQVHKDPASCTGLHKDPGCEFLK